MLLIEHFFDLYYRNEISVEDELMLMRMVIDFDNRDVLMSKIDFLYDSIPSENIPQLKSDLILIKILTSTKKLRKDIL